MSVTASDDEEIEAILKDHDSFAARHELSSEEVASFWRFAVPVVANGVIAPMGFGLGGREGIWHRYIMKVTMVYLRRNIYLLFKTGGNVNLIASLAIIQDNEFKKLNKDYFVRKLEVFPPLSKALSSMTMKDWAVFNNRCERLISVVDEVHESVNNLEAPNLIEAKTAVEKLQEAELFDENEIED